jgi:hypothetical protein
MPCSRCRPAFPRVALGFASMVPCRFYGARSRSVLPAPDRVVVLYLFTAFCARAPRRQISRRERPSGSAPGRITHPAWRPVITAFMGSVTGNCHSTCGKSTILVTEIFRDRHSFFLESVANPSRLSGNVIRQWTRPAERRVSGVTAGWPREVSAANEDTAGCLSPNQQNAPGRELSDRRPEPRYVSARRPPSRE